MGEGGWGGGGGTDGLEAAWGVEEGEGGGGDRGGVCHCSVLLCGCRVHALLQILLFPGLNGGGGGNGGYWRLLGFTGVMGGCFSVDMGVEEEDSGKNTDLE